MIEPRESVKRLVEAVVRAERAREDASSAVVAQRMITRLHEQLGKLIGSLAFDVLVARSLVLARRAHPVLATVTAAPNARLEGLDVSESGSSGREAGALAIAAHFVELLVVLIGEDLALRLVHDAWPTVVDEETR